MGWWSEQIHAGIRFRREYAYQDRWKAWRDYYRGNWAPGTQPHNLFFTLLRTIVPRVYFRNPSISVTPGAAGFAHMSFAHILQRVDNKLFRQMRMKRELKRCVRDAFLLGTGVGKLGFGAQFSPTPDTQSGFTLQPYTAAGERFEYRDDVLAQMPWFSRVHTGRFIVPADLEVFQDARWVAMETWRPTDDVNRDPRLKISRAKPIRPTTGAVRPDALQIEFRRNPEAMTRLIEVRDKKMDRVMVFNMDAGSGEQVLLDDTDEFLIHGAFPYFPIVFNDDDEFFWGVPDSKILEPIQLELNEAKSLIQKHRRVSLLKLIVEFDAMDEAEIEKLTNEDVLAVARAKDVNGIKPMQIGDIPAALVTASELLLKDARESIGFSRNQMGEQLGPANIGNRTSAREAAIIEAAANIRVDERRDTIADVMQDVAEGMHSIIFNHWDQQQVVDVVGPGGVPMWVSFTGPMLKQGVYVVGVDPDTSIPQTKQVRMARAVQMYQLLRDNPLIDPLKLTQYLLTELHSVEFTDMMRILPPVQGAAGGGVVPVDQFTGLIQQQMEHAANNPADLRAPRPDDFEDDEDEAPDEDEEEAA